MTTPEIVIIITTVTTGIVAIVNAISSGWSRQEIKQKTEEAHRDIINKVSETREAVTETANGNILVLSDKIDKLGERVGSIENWIVTERTARTRSTDRE